MSKKFLAGLGLAVSLGLMPALVEAQSSKRLAVRETYRPADADRAKVHVDAAMTLPMEQLVREATLKNPEAMMRYGMALELGRAPATHLLSRSERDVLKEGYRSMTHLYLTSHDKFDINFTEDAMLDQPEFWIYLAKHVGRRELRQSPALFMQSLDSAGVSVTGTSLKLSEPEDSVNLTRNPILRRQMVNAATSCVSSARAFARMKKAQTVDLNEAKVPVESQTQIREEAVKTYQQSYQQGVMACGSPQYFMTVADYAYAHLGAYGEMKDDPMAVIARLGE